MKRSISTGVLLILSACLGAGSLAASPSASGWKVHDMQRPRPPVVTPPPQSLPLPAPSDAVVLFDGRDLSEFQSEMGGPAKWKVEGGVLTVAPGAGPIITRRAFGDVQVHLEWASPSPATGHSQGRGNSGIHLMGRYEVQILDSYQAETYADGQAAAIYGQYPPLVNACRPPGEWQSYDLFFRAPRFDPRGKLRSPARITVIHNGILVQDNVEILGPTIWLHYQPYAAHPERLPFSLQEHGNPVRFRNLWVRELKETDPVVIRKEPLTRLPGLELKRYAGTYTAPLGGRPTDVTVTVKGDHLQFGIPARQQLFDLMPRSEREFVLQTTDAQLVFTLNAEGQAQEFAFSVAGDQAFVAKRKAAR